MKSNQGHRIIKDLNIGGKEAGHFQLQLPAHSLPLQKNVTGQTTAQPQLLQSSQNPLILPRIQTYSSNEQSSEKDRGLMSQLAQRVKELEKENYKLAHHVQQAEQSIRNYREIIAVSASSISSNNAETLVGKKPPPMLSSQSERISPTKSTAHQEKNSKENEIKFKEANQRIEKLELEILSVRKELSECEQESALKSKDAELKFNNLQKLIKEKDLAIEQLTNHSRNLEAQVTSLRIVQSKVSPVKIPDSRCIDAQKASNALQLIKDEIFTMKTAMKRFQTDTKASLSLQANALSSALLAVREHKRNHDNHWQEELLKKKKEFLAFKVEQEQIQNELMQQMKDLQDQCLHQHRQIQSLQQQSPVKLPSSLQSESRTPLKLIPSPLSKDGICSPLIDWKQRETSDALLRDKLKGQEEELNRVTADLDQATASVGKYEQQLQSATNAVAELQQVHLAEIKAVKHLAHVRELVRVAKEREHAIDRDRMSLELKYLREVQNVLSFSIKTAEQSLEEVSPHVVVKLIEGRSKRLQQIEQSFKGKMKDVEQRSADTCAVSSSHLEQFQKKAIDNQKIAEDMSKNTEAQLLSLLKK